MSEKFALLNLIKAWNAFMNSSAWQTPPSENGQRSQETTVTSQVPLSNVPVEPPKEQQKSSEKTSTNGQKNQSTVNEHYFQTAAASALLERHEALSHKLHNGKTT